MLAVAGGDALASVDHATSRNDDLFGYRQFEKKDLALFPQWLRVLQQHVMDTAAAEKCGGKASQADCPLGHWLNFLRGLRKLPRAEQLRKVNRYANRHPYILDSENYGVSDYWATPREFLINDGDCEDYAIIKMLSLQWLGYDVDRMRVVIVQDTNLRTAHAVMSIEMNGDIFILDNQIPEILSHASIYHYVPVYSINAHHWWMHVPR